MPITRTVELKGKPKKKSQKSQSEQARIQTKQAKKEKIAELKKAFVNKLLEFAKEKGHFPWQEPNFYNFPKSQSKLEVIEKSNKENPDDPRKRNEALYRGANLVNLSMVTNDRGYSDSRWATRHHIEELGGKIKEEEKGNGVIIWNYTPNIPYKKKNPETGKMEQVYLTDKKTGEFVRDKNGEKIKATYDSLTSYVVYNVCQAEGLNLKPEPLIRELDPKDKCPEMEIIIANSEAPVKHDQYVGNNRYYSPSEDEVHLPPVNMFKSMSAYYATVAHEIGHSTGHKKRCNRDLSGSFGSDSYAREELVAELTAVFLSSELGIKIPPKELDNHAEYIRSWDQKIKTLTEKPEELSKIINDAQTASDYIKKHMLEKNLKQEKEVEKPAKEISKKVAEIAQKEPPKVVFVKRRSSGKSRSAGASR